MKTSDRGLALIKRHEGLRLDAYKCPAGIWTIGYGHTAAAGVPSVHAGLAITRADAEAILRRDLVQYEGAVAQHVKTPLLQGQFDALVSLCFNIGIGAFAKSSIVRFINAGQMDKVPAQFMRWTRGGGRELPGLVRRRRDEVALWRALSEEGEPDGVDSRKTPEEPPPGTPPAKSTTIWAQIAAAISAVMTPLVGIVTDWRAVAVLGAVVVIIAAGWTIRERVQKAYREGV